MHEGRTEPRLQSRLHHALAQGNRRLEDQSFSDVVARTEAYLRDNPAPQQRSITYFSLGRFLCSVWTWLILVLAAAALFSLRRALRARDRLKQKLHTASFLILFT